MGFAEGAMPSARTKAPEPPNLRGTALARPDTRTTIDLKDLDRFHTIHDRDRS
jgi:hypothetical protein